MSKVRAVDKHSSFIVLVRCLAVIAAGISAFVACGESSQDSHLDRSDYEIVRKGSTVQTTPTPTPATVADTEAAEEQREVHVMAADGNYSIDSFEVLSDFKLSKKYDVDGLRGADAAIYGFFGSDPYDRQEYEARLYPDHDTALTLGADFANEATGPRAVIASSVQRWDEGLTQRRACAANTRGSHHSGRCDLAKYGDYVVAGNLVLLCQGRDSATALENCQALYAALQ